MDATRVPWSRPDFFGANVTSCLFSSTVPGRPANSGWATASPASMISSLLRGGGRSMPSASTLSFHHSVAASGSRARDRAQLRAACRAAASRSRPAREQPVAQRGPAARVDVPDADLRVHGSRAGAPHQRGGVAADGEEVAVRRVELQRAAARRRGTCRRRAAARARPATFSAARRAARSARRSAALCSRSSCPPQSNARAPGPVQVPGAADARPANGRAPRQDADAPPRRAASSEDDPPWASA